MEFKILMSPDLCFEVYLTTFIYLHIIFLFQHINLDVSESVIDFFLLSEY